MIYRRPIHDLPRLFIKQACITGATHLTLPFSNQHHPKSVDSTAQKIYGEVTRPFFPPPRINTEKRSGYARLVNTRVAIKAHARSNYCIEALNALRLVYVNICD